MLGQFEGLCPGLGQTDAPPKNSVANILFFAAGIQGEQKQKKERVYRRARRHQNVIDASYDCGLGETRIVLKSNAVAC